MNKLTKREKVMLYLLTCFLLLAGFLYLLILPILQQHTALLDELVNERLSQMEMRLKIDTMEAVESQIVALETELETLSSGYYSPMTNEQMDKLVTELLLNHGLPPMSLNLVVASPRQVSSWTGSGEGNTGTILTGGATVTTTGSMKALTDLIEEVRLNPAMRIMSFREDEGSIFIDFEIYMYEESEADETKE